MGSQMVFQRYEIKFLLTRKQKECILKAMEPYMELDAYGRSTIRNIYYDTDNYRLVRKSLEKPVYKEKLRVRSYSAAAPEHSQITEEIDYFLRFYQTLAPKVFLSYEREAYYTKEPGEFRVTFDENILCGW